MRNESAGWMWLAGTIIAGVMCWLLLLSLWKGGWIW